MTTKYCCTNKKNECIYIDKTIKTKGKYAIMTLIFGGDGYLPGSLLFGSSVAQLIKGSDISLCCMVTNDVSKEAIKMLSNVFHHILPVDYLQINPNLINHSKEEIRNIYSKTFTKLRCFEFLNYDKILFIDSDTLAIKDDLLGLFNLKTPACLFIGSEHLRYFKNAELLDKFKGTFCNNLHGNLIPYTRELNEKTTHGLNIETSLFLISPSIEISELRDATIKKVVDTKYKIRTDTELVSMMFKNKIYAIEPRFFGRWVNPDEHPEIVLLDLYGYEGKPWHIDKIDIIKNYNDVRFWHKFYVKIYDKYYHKFNSKTLDTLYKSINNLQKNI
jgi:hypothetical protein